MTEENKNKKSIQDKLATLKYNCSEEPHLVVDSKICETCKNKPCTHICPANVYVYDENSKQIIVQYENCLECGACRVACPKKAISWKYPSAGCGVVLKNS